MCWKHLERKARECAGCWGVPDGLRACLPFQEAEAGSLSPGVAEGWGGMGYSLEAVTSIAGKLFSHQ